MCVVFDMYCVCGIGDEVVVYCMDVVGVDF